MNLRHPLVNVGLSILALLCGWAFYLVFRGFDPLRLVLHIPVELAAERPIVLGSVPTFLHALFVLLLFRVFFRERWSMVLSWLLCTAGYETLQSVLPILGTFDWMDLLSIILCSPLLMLKPLTVEPSRILQPTAFGLALLFSVATSGPGRSARISHVPICMSVTELRNSFAVNAAQPLVNAGKIYKNGNLLLVGEQFVGIHVFDNTDPKAPAAVAFLKIPGNTDMAMKGNHLYVDSAIDLLTISMEIGDISLVNRSEDVLNPRTPSDFANSEVYVTQESIDTCKNSGGAVVGYLPREDGAAYKRKIEENKK